MPETQTISPSNAGAPAKDANPQDIVQGRTNQHAQNDGRENGFNKVTNNRNGSDNNNGSGSGNTGQPSTENTNANAGDASSLGFIIPPQDVQKIIVKTAEWVAKKGQSFVEKLRSKQKGQFPFLDPDHFYFVFYKRLLDVFESEIREYGSIQSKIGPELLEKLSDRKSVDTIQKASPTLPTSQPTPTHAPPVTASIPKAVAPPPPVAPSTGASSTAPPTRTTSAPVVGTGSVSAPPTSTSLTAPSTTNQAATTAPATIGAQKTSTPFKTNEVQPGTSAQSDSHATLKKKEALSSRAEGVPRKSAHLTEDPFPRTFAIDIPKDLTEMQFEIIKTTAMYVAKNGMQLLGAISSKHAGNPLFEFTKLSHQHFAFFSKLCDVYKKLIKPSEKLRENILFMADKKNKYKVLQRVYEKAEWDMIERERRRRFRERKKEEQEAMLKVDWQAFSIVETVDFDPEETKNLLVDIVEGFESSSADYSAPSFETREEGADFGIQQHQGTDTSSHLLAESQEALDVIIDEEGKRFVNIGGRRVQIKQDYARQVGTVEKTSEIKYVRAEDGTLIPMSELQHHMKVSLIDPQWKEQKIKEMEKHLFTNLATNAEMAESLSDLARARQENYNSNNTLNDESRELTESKDLKEPTEPPRKRPRN